VNILYTYQNCIKSFWANVRREEKNREQVFLRHPISKWKEKKLRRRKEKSKRGKKKKEKSGEKEK
jgi:hypothetical protein